MTVTGFENAVLSDIRVLMEKDRHSRCFFTALAERKDALRYREMLANEEAVSVKTRDGVILMNGVIESMETREDVEWLKADVVLVSQTILMDREPKSRIFQSSEQTVEDIVRAFRCQGYVLKPCGNFMREKVGIVIQKNCTDFQFLTELTNAFGGGLWIDPDLKSLSVGLPGERDSLDAAIPPDFQENLRRQRKFRYERGLTSVEFITVRKMRPGREIFMDGENYRLVAVEIREAPEHVYYCCRAISGMLPAGELPVSAPVMLRAEVTDNQDSENLGRIQVRFLSEQENQRMEDMCQEPSKRRWIDYLSPYTGKDGGGIVMLPDVGDEVTVHIENRFPLVMGSRRNREIREDCRDVNHKNICIHKASQLEWADDVITVRNGKDVKIVIKEDAVEVHRTEQAHIRMQDGKITAQNGDAEIRMEKDSVEIRLPEGSVKITRDGFFAAHSGQAEIHGDSGAKLFATGGGVKAESMGTTVYGSMIDLKSTATVS